MTVAPALRDIADSLTDRRDRRRRARAILHYEFRKLTSLRSTWITLGLLELVMLVATIDSTRAALRGESHRIDPIYDTTGVAIAQFPAALLGILAVAGEFATGAYRSTALAVPRRRQLGAAKAAMVASFVFIAATSYATIDIVVGRRLLASHLAAVSIGSTIRCAFGLGVYLALISVLGAGLAAILRYSAGALAAIAGLLLIGPQFLPAGMLPEAGTAILRTQNSPNALGGFAVLLFWTAVIGAAGTAALQAHDPAQ